jgi:hypothetical protein
VAYRLVAAGSPASTVSSFQLRPEVFVTLQSLLLRALPLPPPGRLLAENEWRTLARIAEVLVSDVEEVPAEDIADNVEGFLIRGHSQRAWRVRALLNIVEWTPLSIGQKPLSRMSLAERRRLVEEYYVDGRGIWSICAKVRYLVLMGAYGDGRLHAPTSFVPVSRRRRFSEPAVNGVGAVAS